MKKCWIIRYEVISFSEKVENGEMGFSNPILEMNKSKAISQFWRTFDPPMNKSDLMSIKIISVEYK